MNKELDMIGDYIRQIEEELYLIERTADLKQQKIDKAIEWVHKHISKYNCKGITIIDWNELSNPNDLLEILGEKE